MCKCPITYRLLRCFIGVLLLLPSQKLFASHIVGADLYYTWVSGLTYKITLVLYGDCGPASAGVFATLGSLSANPKICIYDGATLLPGMPISLGNASPLAGTEITPVCPDSIGFTQCTDPTFTIPGIKKFEYSGTYTLPHTSTQWRFVFNGDYGSATAGRAAAITNIGSGTTIQLVDTLNNSTVPNNSSPIMTVIPTPFFCLNHDNGYSPGAVDADGDDLIFALEHAPNGTRTCTLGGLVTYTGTAWPGQLITPTTPLRCVATSYSFDSTTGQILFHPDYIQRAVVVYNIREFRGGVFVGSCQREMTFLVRPCVNVPPSGIYNSASAGLITDSTHFRICSGMGAFSIFMNPTDLEGNDITVSASGLPAGATFTTSGNGTTAPHSTFSWTTTGVSPGSYIFFVTFTDDNCPESGTLTRAFTVTIDPAPTPITGTFTVCAGTTTPLANATPGGTWSSSSPSIATVATTGIVTGISSGTAVISYNLPFGCITTATVTVDTFSAGVISGPPSVCVGDTMTLSATAPGGVWSTTSSTVSISSSGVVTGVSIGTALISYTTTGLCGTPTATTIVTVGLAPTVTPITGPSAVCVGGATALASSTPGGSWTSIATSVATISSSGVVTGVSGGTTTISYTITNSCGSVAATAIITVNPLPTTTPITGPSVLCVGDTITLSNATPGGTWSSSGASASVDTGGIVTGIANGTATISYAVSNSCGTLYTTTIITVNTLPDPGTITGGPNVCEGATVTLTESVVGGVWSSGSTNATVSSSGVVAGITAGTAIISYSVTNMCGTTVATIVITIDPLPVVTPITGTGIICVGATTTLTCTPSGGVWSSGATSVATISPVGVVTGISGGTATISYSVTNGCGTVAATKVVTVNTLPSVGPITGPSVVCVGLTIPLSCATPGGIWSSSGTATVGPTGIVTGVSGGAATISYSVSNSCGTSYVIRVITVNNFPDPGLISGPSMVCEGATITLSETVSGGTWSGGSPNASVSAAGVVTGLTAGTAVISYTVTNSCGSVSATHIVTIEPTPSAGVITGPNHVCQGSSITLSNAVTGGSWSSSSSNATISVVGAVTGVTHGTATISYTVTLGMCTAYTTYMVTVDPLPDAGVISGGPMVCTDNVITMIDAAPGGVWSCSANASITSTGVLTGLTVGTATVSYTVTNSCGTDVATSVITINLTPDTGTISGLDRVCEGANTTLTASVGGGVWSSSTLSVAYVTPTGSVHGVSTGTAVISYTVSNAYCTAFTTKIVTVDPLAVPGTIIGRSSLCEGDSIALTSSMSGGVWSMSGGSGATLSTTGLLTAVTAGTVMVSYTVTNICGPVTATKLITINPLPDPGNIIGPHIVCLGTTVSFNNGVVAGGVWGSTNTSVATISVLGLVTPVSVGTTLITYIVTNSAGCNSTISHVVTVSPLPPPGVISGPSTVCINATIQLTETESGGTWSSSDIYVAPINSITGKVHTLAPGNVVITYTTAPNGAGCVNIATYPLTLLLNSPVIIYEKLSDVSCFGNSDGSISVTPSGGAGPWQYIWKNGVTRPAIANLTAGHYGVEVIDESSKCSGKKDYIINEPDPIELLPSVKNDECNMANGSIKLAVNGGTTPYFYKWYDNSTSDGVAGLLPGTYDVEVSDNNQCKEKLAIDVLEGDCDEINVHNGISPNEDGVNDLWIIGGLQNYPNNLVQLFDKWGDKVFEQRGYDNKWGGRGLNGSEVPDGTYFYLIRLNADNGAGGKNVLTGPLLIKR